MNPARLIFFLMLFVSAQVYSQQTDSTGTVPSKTITVVNPPLQDEMEISDIFKKIFKIKNERKHDSVQFKIGRILLALLPGVGYSQQTNFTGIITANASFYNGRREHTNISIISTNLEYAPINKQVFIPFVFNIWLKNNKLNIIGDLRYIKFPHYTFGVGGGQTSQNIKDKVNFDYFKSYLTVFKPLVKDLYVGVGYSMDYHWNVSNRDTNTNFQDYNQNDHITTSSGATASFKYDSRRNANNPQGGNFLSITYRANMKALKSDKDWQSLIIDGRKYFKLRTVRDNILAFWSYNWLTFGDKVPYFDLPSTGWDTYANLGMGYIQGRFRANKLIFLESEYRFGITRNGLLGAVVFANAQYISEWPSNKFVHLYPATGGGIRIKLNKHSRVNVAADYCVGIDGSRGFFFNIGEVF